MEEGSSRDLVPKTIHFKASLLLVLIATICIFPTSVQSKLTITKECGEIVCKPHNYCSQVDHSCRPCQIACDPVLGNYDQTVCEKDCQDYLHDLWYIRRQENESEFNGELYIDLYYKVQEDLRLLKILIGIVIILSTIVLLALLGIMIYFKRLRNRFQQQGGGESPYFKRSKKLEDYPIIYSNNKVLSLPFPDISKGPPSHVSSSINNNMSRGSSPDLVSRTVTSSAPSYNAKKDKNSINGFVMENPAAKGISSISLREKQSRLKKEPSESTLPEYHAYDNPAMVSSPVRTHM